jgi:hypothetical protein
MIKKSQPEMGGFSLNEKRLVFFLSESSLS